MSQKKKGMDRRKTLDSLIGALPSPDVQEKDLKELALQLILDVPKDDSNTKAARAKVKLEALKLLAEIVRNESKGSTEAALLALLNEDDD